LCAGAAWVAAAAGGGAGGMPLADTVVHPSSVAGGLGCVAWRQTGACDPQGQREPEHDQVPPFPARGLGRGASGIACTARQ
jgi:hypothetical protein